MAEGPNKPDGSGSSDAAPNRGFLWGCILPAVLVVLLVSGWFVYNTYYFTAGYKEAPGLPVAMAAVRANPVAHAMLGDDIQIMKMELNMPSGPRADGRRIFYKVRVKGSKAEGEVQTSVLISDGTTKITSLKLIGPDDTPRNLLSDGR